MRILKVQNLMQRLPQSLIYLKHQSVIGLKKYSEECQYTTNNNNKSNIDYVSEIKALNRQLKEKDIDFLKKPRYYAQREVIFDSIKYIFITITKQ